MDTQLIFVRRQSPDWASLSHDFRAGRAIDPARFVPDHVIPGFPDNIAALIDRWNHSLSIDFFTFRAIISSLSKRNIKSIAGVHTFEYENAKELISFIKENRSLICFHDDDDFFSPKINLIKDYLTEDIDVIVTPLLRVGIPVFTFVREGHSSDVVIGEQVDFHFKFQTNNYAINGNKIRRSADFTILKDHVTASYHADEAMYSELVLHTLLGCTVKTPASASMMPMVMNADGSASTMFVDFIASIAAVQFPSTCGWITSPLEKIVRMLEIIIRGSGVEAIADLLHF